MVFKRNCVVWVKSQNGHTKRWTPPYKIREWMPVIETCHLIHLMMIMTWIFWVAKNSNRKSFPMTVFFGVSQWVFPVSQVSGLLATIATIGWVQLAWFRRDSRILIVATWWNTQWSSPSSRLNQGLQLASDSFPENRKTNHDPQMPTDSDGQANSASGQEGI